MKRWLCAAALLAGMTSAATAQEALKLVDLTDDYQRIWTSAQALPVAKRVSFFKNEWAKIIPGFYDHKRLEKYGTTEQKYDEFIGKMLVAYPDKRADIQRVSGEFQERFTPALATFETAFGPMRGYPPIYLVNSHNEFDGGTRELPEGVRLMFGADVIARLYKDRPIQPFFHHELFHLYHNRIFPECDQVWCSLWSEGLATYVAAQLNPTADDDALLLTVPAPLRPAVENNRAEAICAVATRLDSEEAKDYGPLFMGGGEPLSANLPRRFGYYVGYLVAQDLGKTRSLKELANLTPEQTHPLIEESLASMAACPAKSEGERG